MGIPVLILGASGSGKSTSLRNFIPEKVGIFNVASKPLPFKNKLKKVNSANYGVITKGLKANSLKCYVVDDSQYLMVFEEFEKVDDIGFKKFTEIALHFYNLIQTVINDTSNDTIVYFLHHTEKLDDGRTKAKTVGKMIDSKLTLEGLFSIVLLAETDGKEHYFITQSDGMSTAKSPMDMFDLRIPNDLKAVDAAIRAYYELNSVTEKGENEQ